MSSKAAKWRFASDNFPNSFLRHASVPLLLIPVIGLFDFHSGTEVSVAFFYLIPICIAAWYQKRWYVWTIVGTVAVTWFVVEIMSGHFYTSPMALCWNAAARLGIFALVGFMVMRIRELQIRQNDMINYIVHDMRNPLHVIQGNVELIRENIPSSGNDPAGGPVQECWTACRRLGGMIDSILDLARMEHGRLPLRRENVPIREIVESSLQDVSEAARRGQVSLLSDIKAGMDVHVDRELTVRIIVNLLGNALKVSPRSSVVTIRALALNNNETILAVDDKGPGIPWEYVPYVFDKFVQADMRRDGVMQGSGLGLAFCKMATEIQGGRIWIESESGVGTKVMCALPAAKTS